MEPARGNDSLGRRVPLAQRAFRLAPDLDNADTPEAAAEVEKTLPQLEGGQVIITSRIVDWSPAVQPVELDVLAEEDAAAFLLERTESRRKKMLTDSGDAGAGAFALPLALEQGGRLRLAKIRVSFSEYRTRWESRKQEVLAWHDERLMLYPKSVANSTELLSGNLDQAITQLGAPYDLWPQRHKPS